MTVIVDTQQIYRSVFNLHKESDIRFVHAFVKLNGKMFHFKLSKEKEKEYV